MSTESINEPLDRADGEGVYFNNTKLVYSASQHCLISNIPLIDPGLPPLPPGTIVYIEGLPNIEDGLYEVPADAVGQYNLLPDTMKYQP